jgi:hypothetical protein
MERVQQLMSTLAQTVPLQMNERRVWRCCAPLVADHMGLLESCYMIQLLPHLQNNCPYRKRSNFFACVLPAVLRR